MEGLLDLRQKMVEEQATGCRGVHGYAAWAKAQGYTHCKVYDWTSSAGDWTFLVSKNGHEWHVMSQENNWPRAGFSYCVGDTVFFGSFEDVCEDIIAFYG